MKKLLPLALVVAMVADSFGAEVRVGASQVVITPPAGTPMAGYYNMRSADGVLDDLYAKALVIESEGTTCALVALDVITIPRPFTVETRAAIERESGIPGSHIMISATHQHTGPALPRGGTRDELSGASSPEAEPIPRNSSAPGARKEAAKCS